MKIVLFRDLKKSEQENLFVKYETFSLCEIVRISDKKNKTDQLRKLLRIKVLKF